MLIETIKADRLAAMKSRDELRKNLLGTLVAAATKDTKAPDDATVAKTAALVPEIARGDDRPARGPRAWMRRSSGPERAILEAICRRRCREQTLRASIEEIVAALPERSPKAMGQVMAALKDTARRRARQPGGQCAGARRR